MKIKTSFISTIIIAVVFPLLSPLLSSAYYDQNAAQNYLLSKTGNPWATIALSSLGASNIPSDYLKNIQGTEAINYEVPI
jgi:hypothetical protein